MTTDTITNPKRKRKPVSGVIVCADCGNETARRGASQRYCPKCSEQRDLKRKKKHHLERGKKRYEETRTQFGLRGVVLNATEKLGLAGSMPPMPEMAWYKRVGVPFSWAGSKNHIFANTARGHVFMREESSYMRNNLTEQVAAAVSGQRIAQNKLWIDIFVEKPTARGDAVNFVDMVCDAVKDGLLLDDRWFSIRCVDWRIVKFEPAIYVGFGQESLVDLQACSSCGRFLTYDNFQRNRARPAGIGLNCRECQATTVKNRKRDRAQAALQLDLGHGIFG